MKSQIAVGITLLGAGGIAWGGPIELLTNGGFETGTLAGWTTTLAPGVGTTTPVFGSVSASNLVAGANPPLGYAGTAPGPGPSGGSWYAMYDQSGAFGARLEQDFVATSGPLTVSFDVYGGDSAFAAPLNSGAFANVSSLAQQYLRVDLVNGAAGAGGSVVANLFDLTQSGNFQYHQINVAPLVTVGNTYSLRFEAVDNKFYLIGGFDNASVIGQENPVIPLPTGAAMAMVGLGVIGIRRRRRG